MEGSYSFDDQLFNALVDGRFEEIWRLAAEAPRAPEVSLSAALHVPTPYPATWAAWALADFDRAFRWALRSAEAGVSVPELVASRARPARSYRGITLVEVAPGSWISKLDPTDDLAKVFKSKHWLVFGGLLLAFGSVDWTVRSVFVGDSAQGGPKFQSDFVYGDQIAPVVRDVNGNVTITINQNRYEVRCGPSNSWLPRSDADHFGR